MKAARGHSASPMCVAREVGSGAHAVTAWGTRPFVLGTQNHQFPGQRKDEALLSLWDWG
jgi:hypothetical protein